MAHDDGTFLDRGLERINPFAEWSAGQAARVAGTAFMVSFVLIIIIGNFLLPNFVNPGDKEELEADIKDNEQFFNIAVVMYLIVLLLDAIVAMGIVIVLNPVDRTLASVSGTLRLIYVVIMVIIVVTLAAHLIDVDSYGTFKLVGYLFFTGHILVTGYAVYISGYIPRIFGVFYMLAFISYILAFYVSSLVPEAILTIFMIFMIIAELSLSVWFVLKGTKLDGMIEERVGEPTSAGLHQGPA